MATVRNLRHRVELLQRALVRNQVASICALTALSLRDSSTVCVGIRDHVRCVDAFCALSLLHLLE